MKDSPSSFQYTELAALKRHDETLNLSLLDFKICFLFILVNEFYYLFGESVVRGSFGKRIFKGIVFFGVYILNGRTATQSMVYKTFQTKLPVLPNLGIIGQTLFNYGFMVYAAIILAVILHHVLNHTRTGLNLRAIGENPATADAAGISVTKYKYWATCLGAGISGLGGLYYVLDYNQGIWATTTQIEALGWLAVALVIFTTWKPLNAIWGSYLFGLLYWLYQFLPTLLHISVPGYVTDLIQMVPYLVTIVVLVVTSLRKKRENQPPASLGLAYFREER